MKTYENLCEDIKSLAKAFDIICDITPMKEYDWKAGVYLESFKELRVNFITAEKINEETIFNTHRRPIRCLVRPIKYTYCISYEYWKLIRDDDTAYSSFIEYLKTKLIKEFKINILKEK